eukprot:811750-Prymnesium_polylepis.1
MEATRAGIADSQPSAHRVHAHDMCACACARMHVRANGGSAQDRIRLLRVAQSTAARWPPYLEYPKRRPK